MVMTVMMEVIALRLDWTSCDLLSFLTRISHETLHERKTLVVFLFMCHVYSLNWRLHEVKGIHILDSDLIFGSFWNLC